MRSLGMLVIEVCGPAIQASCGRRGPDGQGNRRWSTLHAQEATKRPAGANWAWNAWRPAVPQLLGSGVAGRGTARERMSAGARQAVVGATPGIQGYAGA